MIFDNEMMFSKNATLSASGVSTNVVDLGANGTGSKSGLELAVLVSADFAGGTSVCVTLETDDNDAFASTKTVLQTADIAVADLVKGYRFLFGCLPHGVERYVRLSYTVSGTMTAGAITAGLLLDA